MPRVAPIELQDNEHECLIALIKKGTDWPERDQAETIVSLANRHIVQTVAVKQNLCREAMRIRRRKWLKWGLVSSSDQPRAVH